MRNQVWYIAYLSGVAGLFGTADGWLLKLTSTAIAALLLELSAITLLFREQTAKSEEKS